MFAERVLASWRGWKPLRWRSFQRDERGATAVEFAFVVTPFFGFVLLILQVGLYYFSVQSLDFAVKQAGRAVMTGQVAATAVSASTFKNAYICPKVFFTISCDKLTLNSFKVGKTSDATASTGVYAYIDVPNKKLKPALTDPKTQKFCLGGPGDYIYIDAAYPYPNFMKRLLSETASDTWLMRSSAVVFNEPKTNNPATSC